MVEKEICFRKENITRYLSAIMVTTIWNSYLELSTEYYRNTIVAATCVHKAVKRMHQKKHPLVSSEAHN
jgi:hypothetical protein